MATAGCARAEGVVKPWSWAEALERKAVCWGKMGESAIDQRFARGIGPDRDDATIVQTVISLGHGLGIRMIARGVETLEQLLFLHQHE